MTELRYDHDADTAIARITIDTPGPVNVIGERFITELATATGRAIDDGARGLVLLSGKERSFLDGANLKEIVRDPSVLDLRHLVLKLHEALRTLARAPFAVAAVLEGQTALGGGCETILWACDKVFATPGSKLGLPEVNLGLLPAAGGPDALRRLVGLEAMMDVVMNGRSLPAESLVDSGLVSMVEPGEAAAAAETWLLSHPGVTNRNYDEEREEPGALDGDEATAIIARYRDRFTVCPEKPWLRELVEHVEEGLDLPFDAAVTRVVDRFAPLIADRNCRNKIDLFFTMTQVGPGLHRTAVDEAREVETLAVMGAGLMGRGIAQVSADAGMRVLLYDVDLERAEAGRRAIGESLEPLVAGGRWSGKRLEELLGRITPAVDYEALASVPLVVESVFEDLELKRAVLARVRAVNPTAVFATNTSTLPIAEIADGSDRPELVVGMHYFSPVERMPLLEVVRSSRTGAEALATAAAVGRRQGKTVIVVGDGPGFYTSRTFGVFVLTGFFLAEMGVDPWDVDFVARMAGFPQGPLHVYGTAGGSVITHAARAMHERMPGRIVVPRTLVAMYEAGYVGAGKPCFYERGLEPDESARELVVRDPDRRTPEREEVREMLLLSMVAQAFLCVDDGVIEDFYTMDLGAVLGVGFPDCWHGPARYVSQHGVRATRERLAELADAHGLPFFEPAREFDRLLACGVDRGLV